LQSTKNFVSGSQQFGIIVLPVLPQLEELSIRNNSLIILDGLKLSEKFQVLKQISIASNNWTCDYYENSLQKQLEKSNITEEILFDEYNCLHNLVDLVEVKTCPNPERNSTHNKQYEEIIKENQKDGPIQLKTSSELT
jgi:hypothetical protein